MKIVFQENPKFGDEQDVTQQIISIDESIEKLLAEIKRFEVINQSSEWGADCSTNTFMNRPIRSSIRNS
jgi:hypothetical protein